MTPCIWLPAALLRAAASRGGFILHQRAKNDCSRVATACANRLDFVGISLTVILGSLCVKQQSRLVPAFNAQWIGATRKVLRILPIADEPVRARWDVEAMKSMVEDFEQLADGEPEDFVKFSETYGPAPVCRGHIQPILHPGWSYATCVGMLTDNPHIWYIRKAREFRTARRLARGFLRAKHRIPWVEVVEEEQLWPECGYIYGRRVLCPKRHDAVDFALRTLDWWETAWQVWWHSVVSPIEHALDPERSALQRLQYDVRMWVHLAQQLGPIVFGVRLCRACGGRILAPDGPGRRPSYCTACQAAGMRARLNSREYRKRRQPNSPTGGRI
jgi:hypothetical protein